MTHRLDGTNENLGPVQKARALVRRPTHVFHHHVLTLVGYQIAARFAPLRHGSAIRPLLHAARHARAAALLAVGRRRVDDALLS